MLLSVEQAQNELRRAQEQQALEQRTWARRVAEATQRLDEALRANRAGSVAGADEVRLTPCSAEGGTVNACAVDETQADPLAAVRDAARAAFEQGATQGAVDHAVESVWFQWRREDRQRRAVQELRTAIAGPNGRSETPLYGEFAKRVYDKAVQLSREGLLS